MQLARSLPRLRPVQRADAVHLERWSNDSETRRLQGARAEPHTPISALEEVEKIIGGNGGTHHAFMIEVDGHTIGNCWLGHLDGNSASLGIVIGEPEYRGRGIGTQVMRRLLEFATTQGIRHVHLWTLATNEQAIRVYRRVGFVEGGRQIRDVPSSGRVETINMERIAN